MTVDSKKEIKKFAWIFFSIVTGAVLSSVLFVLVTDPFYQYHAPWLDMPVVMEEAVYQTPGAARNLQYSDAIIGTSMTENFHTSWFDEEMGWNTVKLSYSGARTDDLKAILTSVFSKKEPVNHIFMDLNDYQLTVPGWTAYVERPAYLYDTLLWNDYPYLLNRDVFAIGYARVLDALEGRESNMDTAYTWEDADCFGKEIVLAQVRDARNRLLAQPAVRSTAETESQISVCQENLDNILPFIEAHPETEFIVFLPPYSIVYWEQKLLQGNLEEILEVYGYAMGQLLQYDNVSVYYFQDEREIITDLDNYRDISHHRPEYNRYIFEAVRDGKKRVTRETLEEIVRAMYDFVRGYDYEDCWR